jgi:hypothetical protein
MVCIDARIVRHNLIPLLSLVRDKVMHRRDDTLMRRYYVELIDAPTSHVPYKVCSIRLRCHRLWVISLELVD